ncbi:MAG TPA: hypothetical protein VFV23_08770 [Verrucomicrobiae bacterium]|nr:hypothetical protein [Verrucomicrobiae bacterium]
MNLKTCLIAVATTTLIALPAIADTDTDDTNSNSHSWRDYWAGSDVNSFYRAHEISIDVFGMGSLGESDINHLTGDKVVHDGRVGAGGGVNLFFCKWVGVGGDVYTEGWDRELASGNLILRLPIPNTGLAPYVMGGGGYEWDDTNQGIGQIGGGLELRFMKHLGVFVDARYVFADRTDDFGVGRAGLRFNF